MKQTALASASAPAISSVAKLRKKLSDAHPRQWWRANGYGLQPNGKFKCPCCGDEIEVLPYRKGIGRVRSHKIAGRSRCIFANHMEPLNAKLSDSAGLTGAHDPKSQS